MIMHSKINIIKISKPGMNRPYSMHLKREGYRAALFRKYGLRYGKSARTIAHMKTTIDLDERRLAAVMKLTGLKTRKAAVDYALCAAERQAALDRLLERALPDAVYRTAVDPHYDVAAQRQRERP